MVRLKQYRIADSGSGQDLLRAGLASEGKELIVFWKNVWKRGDILVSYVVDEREEMRPFSVSAIKELPRKGSGEDDFQEILGKLEESPKGHPLATQCCLFCSEYGLNPWRRKRVYTRVWIHDLNTLRAYQGKDFHYCGFVGICKDCWKAGIRDAPGNFCLKCAQYWKSSLRLRLRGLGARVFRLFRPGKV